MTIYDDLVADAVRRHPDRLQGFAILATLGPATAAAELRRAVAAPDARAHDHDPQPEVSAPECRRATRRELSH